MTKATTKMLSVVSEAGGGPWNDSPGLTEDLMSEWLGVQEDRGAGLRDKVIRKQEELVRMEEVEDDDFPSPVGTGQSTDQAPLHFDPSGRSIQGPGSSNTVEAAREGREGRKESATTGLLTAIPNVNKRKNKNGGGKERIGGYHRGDRTGRWVQQTKGGAYRSGPKQDGGEVGKVCKAIQ